MRLIGFVQSRNCVENGLLRWCLESLSKTTDFIVVYDDASTEAVRPIYEEFGCLVLYGERNEFHKELYHKAQLLAVALRYQPDWIVWIDSDAILGPYWEDRSQVERALSQAGDQGLVRLHLHNLNLWRSYGWYRTDQAYNDLWHGVCWRNTNELHYEPVGRLHLKQFPHAFHDPEKDAHAMRLEPRFQDPRAKLLHCGFVRDEEIARKFFTYRAHGQSGWALERLVSESPRLNPQTGQVEERTLEPVPAEWYPQWLLDSAGETLKLGEGAPFPRFTPEEMATYGSYEEWCERAGAR